MNQYMANRTANDNFIIWLIIYIISAPLAIIILAWEFFTKKDRR